MKTVASLIRELGKFPPDALCYAYEGEVRGIVVVGPEVKQNANGGRGRPQLGYVPATEDEADDGDAEVG